MNTPKKSWRKHISALVGLLSTFSWMPAARADLSDSLYRDVKDVLEELIAEETAKTVITNLACTSPNGLALHYPKTLQRAYDRQFNTLRRVMTDETIDIASLYLWKLLDPERTHPVSWKEVMPFENAPNMTCRTQMSDGPERYARNEREQYKLCKPTEKDEETFGGTCKNTDKKEVCKNVERENWIQACKCSSMSKKYVRDTLENKCKEAKDKDKCLQKELLQWEQTYGQVLLKDQLEEENFCKKFSEGEVQFSMVSAFRALMQKKPEVAEEHLKVIVGGLLAEVVGQYVKVPEEYYPLLRNRLTSVLREALSGGKKSAVRLTIPDPAQLSEYAQKGWEKLEEDSPDLASAALMMNLENMKLLVDKQDGNNKSNVYSGYLSVFLADKGTEFLKNFEDYQQEPNSNTILNEVLENTLCKRGLKPGLEGVCSGSTMSSIQSVEFDREKITVTLTAGSTQKIGLPTKDLKKFKNAVLALRLHSNLPSVLSPYTDLINKFKEPTRPSLRVGLFRAEQAIEEISLIWENLAARTSGKMSPVVFASVLADEDGPVGRLCKEPDEIKNKDFCQKFRLVMQSTRTTGPFLKAISNGDIREVAVTMLREASKTSLLPTGQGSEDVDCKDFTDANDDKNKYCGSVSIRFGIALASYVLESSDDKVSETTRQIFKRAAMDVLRTSGPNSGFERSPKSSFIFPRAALRLSFSGGYANEAGTQGLRYIPSTNWFTFRLRATSSDRFYLAFPISLLDPVAPFAEMALRKQTGKNGDELSYGSPGLVALTFIQPRVDAMMGSPLLSSHLAVSAGLSWRIIAPHKNKENENYTYKAGADSKHFEMNFGVTYIP